MKCDICEEDRLTVKEYWIRKEHTKNKEKDIKVLLCGYCRKLIKSEAIREEGEK